MTKSSPTLIMIFAFTVTGCGSGDGQDRARMQVPELGLSMDVPSGWRVDGRNPRLCAKGDSTGVVMDEPLEGKAFAEHVRRLSEAQGGRVLSSKPLAISGCDAIQAVIEYPTADSKSIKV